MEAVDSERLPMSASLNRASTATQLLEKRKQMQVVQETLEAQKKGYIHREKAFARREDNLRKKDLELQEALVLFNRFLKQNESKRRQAQQAAENERKQKDLKIVEINQKKQTLEQLKNQCEILKAQVESNEKYKKFLLLVWSSQQGDFEERDHVMYRYWSLKDTYKELADKRKRMEAEAEELTRALKDETKAHHTLSLELNNDYASNTKKLEKILAQKSKELAKIEDQEQFEAARRLQLGSIIMSVENLYNRCCKNEAKVMNKPPLLSKKTTQNAGKPEDQSPSMLQDSVSATVKKLAVIERYLKDFTSICEMWRQEKGETNKKSEGSKTT